MKEYNILELQKLMEQGKVTAKKLVKEYLERIKKIDKNGPKINAIIELNPDAEVIAEKLDKERKNGKIRSKIHGIPVVIKDNIGTADKMMTTAGSLAFEGHFPKEDAFIIKKLREAGAIILAKANLSEWANFRGRRSTSGWSSRGGLTRNPYILDRSACGSSSGSAVAVAANLCTVAIGTETDGSVICPSQINSIVGIKPSIGLVSRNGIIPISHNQDTAGPMARTVEDAAILLSIISAKDPKDEVTKNAKSNIDFTSFLDKDGLAEARIGVARDFFGKMKYVDELMEKAIEMMKKLGAEIIDPIKFDFPENLGEAEYTVLCYDFKHDMNNYLKEIGTDIPHRTLADLIEFNKQYKEKIMPYFGQEAFIMAEEKGPLTDEEYKKALEKCQKATRENGIDKLFKDHKLDAIIAPSGGPAWPIDLINGDNHSLGSSRAAAISGYPSLTVPLGFVHELPVGISFIGQAFEDGKMIKLAYAFEQRTKARKPPKFIPTFTP